MNEFPNFLAILPELFLLTMICIALLGDLFIGHTIRNLAYRIIQLALIGCAIITLFQFDHEPVVTFNGLFVDDLLSRLLKLFIYISAFFAFVYSRYYVEDRNMPRAEYHILGGFSVLGMMIVVSAHSFLTIFLGLELFAIPIYAMVALQRENLNATEAALKYFVMGAIASALLLYGMSILYGATGSLDISVVSNTLSHLTNASNSLLFTLALVFIAAGLAFKLAAAPFHMWVPDVYSGAPTSVTLFLSCGPKLAALGMTYRLLIGALPELSIQWHQLLLVMSVLSMAFGNILAITQSNIKRLLAYSAISHMGYMLLGLVAGTQEGYSASLFYMLIYTIMSLGAFGMLVLLSNKNIEIENVDDLQGLNSRQPWLALMMLIIMFSLAGIPPTIGFFAKLFVLDALVASHQTWLAAVALGFAILGAYYYIRIVKVMYFTRPAEPTLIQCPRNLQIAMSINGLALLFLGIFPGIILQLCREVFGL